MKLEMMHSARPHRIHITAQFILFFSKFERFSLCSRQQRERRLGRWPIDKYHSHRHRRRLFYVLHKYLLIKL